ncbi:hypothetical protein IE81DRAFT_347476 [Ceraceosorus guamensis]|uniref:Gti1/Pac2 family-domain-containing protein n=1 Tax=Ceraceosorus guamensis TaxID=1522189 RepID=A0A316VY49_9BASI|nr:hypothetical protein IE81DRAFT_347476 [Ceraceosorus guamensis]PWN42372.1 hypothetical protein IE81DRAFT_347476 [Ceraceosorus guamensis]
MGGITEPTFTGYIASTHDALLVFEAVRQKKMSKIPRRLRDDERKLIRSGSVFVFDERESGIKRWTDGLLWSPSRILMNFLVYRQIDKKQHQVKGSSDPSLREDDSYESMADESIGTGLPVPATTEELHPFELGVPMADFPGTDAVNDFLGLPSTDLPYNPNAEAMSRLKSEGSVLDTAAAWNSAASDPSGFMNFGTSTIGFAGAGTAASGSLTDADTSASQSSGNVGRPKSAPHSASAYDQASLAKREADFERSLVGSLTNSYPFAKNGLCKKTISMQVEGSTQHLISYYSVEDVRAGRLRTPSTLPEISAIQISPVFLSKSSFRFPPKVFYDPDGQLRYCRDTNVEDEGAYSLDLGSSGEGTSGSDSRSRRESHEANTFGLGPRHAPGYGRTVPPLRTAGNMSTSGWDAWTSSNPASPDIQLPAGVGDNRPFNPGMPRRASDALTRSRLGSGRFEPYPGATAHPMAGSGSPPLLPHSGYAGGPHTSPIQSPQMGRHRADSERRQRIGPRLHSSQSMWNLSEFASASQTHPRFEAHGRLQPASEFALGESAQGWLPTQSGSGTLPSRQGAWSPTPQAYGNNVAGGPSVREPPSWSDRPIARAGPSLGSPDNNMARHFLSSTPSAHSGFAWHDRIPPLGTTFSADTSANQRGLSNPYQQVLPPSIYTPATSPALGSSHYDGTAWSGPYEREPQQSHSTAYRTNVQRPDSSGSNVSNHALGTSPQYGNMGMQRGRNQTQSRPGTGNSELGTVYLSKPSSESHRSPR